ncbi:MAG TPA: FG-GAP-like repeat-containing protein [Candidatus Eisenbacteria bacterium]|nr:FG-GAP-like repeat-containing protein [Candidatus Eisenbacteria bacterium]
MTCSPRALLRSVPLLTSCYLALASGLLVSRADAGVFENGAILSRITGSVTELATGDLDGDGHIDVVIDDAALAKVQLLRGLGNGHLEFAGEASTGPSPGPLAVGDLNGDGRADVIVTNRGAASLSVVLSLAAGFQSQPVSLPGVPAQAQLTDLDDDGSRDILVALTSPAELGWLRGNGNGTFQPYVMLSSISQGTPRQVEVADFDADGDLDVAVLAMSGLFPTVLVGLDTGSGLSPLIALPSGQPGGPGPMRINPRGQFGVPEVCLFDLGPILGPGGFRGAPRYFSWRWDGQSFVGGVAGFHSSLPVSSAFRIMELNGQGVGDFVIGTDIYCIVPQIGAWSSNPTFGGPGLAAADMNGDGKADLVGASCQAVSVSLLTPVGDYTIESGGGAGYKFPIFKTPSTSFVVGELDEDAHLDAALVRGDSLWLRTGSAAGTFSSATLIPISTPMPRPLRLADINGDGRLDLVAILAQSSSDSRVVVVPNGVGTTFGTPVSTPVPSLVGAFGVGDANGDGRADVLVDDLDMVRVLKGNADGTLTETWSRALGDLFRGLRFADLDRDGALDLVLAGLDGGITSAHGNGDGTFADPVSFNGPLTTGDVIGVGDLDRDGVEDVCIGTETGLVSMKGLGGGALGPPVLTFASQYVLLDEFGDVDYDGIPDAIIRRSGGACSAPLEVARGLGDGTFELEGVYLRGFADEVVLAPLEDATLDLLFSTRFTVAEFSVLRNVTPVHSITASAAAGGSITPSGTVPVAEGADRQFQIVPAQNFGILDVLVDGVSVGAVSSYTFEDVSADHTIHATFIASTLVEVDFGIDRIRLGGNHLGHAVPTYIEPAGPETPADIVAASIRLNGVVSIDPSFTPVIGDHDRNGISDLEVQFRREDLDPILPAGDAVPVHINGAFTGGGLFHGSDVVAVRRPKIHVPRGNSSVVAGTEIVVEYELLEGANWVALLHSMDDGATWTLDATEQQNDGTLLWHAPNAVSQAARLAIAQVESGSQADPEVIGVLAVSEAFQITSLVGVPEIPSALELAAILPTPSRGVANIGFALPRTGRVRLDVLDLAGRRVTTLHEGSLEAGRHQRVWKGERTTGGLAPAGVYLVRLWTEQGERVRRVVWMR